MSRQHKARVRGSADVLLVCDECGKREWATVGLTEDDTCLEWDAVEARDDWHYADDALVCNNICAANFWNW